MKHDFLWMRGALVVATTLMFLLPARAQEWIRYQARPGSKVTIEGTSTLHDWAVEGGIIGGVMEVAEDFEKNFPPTTITVNPKVDVQIPVRSLKSGKNLMDGVMQETMNAEKHPRITYRLLELTPPEGGNAKAGSYTAKGELTVAGVKKVVEMPVTMQRLAADRLKISGKTPLKMTDFGMKPPAPAIGLGLVKTSDDVTVSFEWVVARAKTAG